MKKALFGWVMLGVVIAVFGTTGFVYAQSSGPTTAPTAQPGFGPRMGQGFGRGMGGGMGRMANPAAGTPTGVMHDEMMAAFAQKLGLTEAELNTQLAQGQTLAQIAASKGYTADQFTALWSEARSQALDQAVKNGELTQAQADWMNQRSAGRQGGMMSGGRFANMNCPFYQSNP